MTTHNEHRDQLAAIVYRVNNPAYGDYGHHEETADAILAAGWRKQGAAHPDLIERAARAIAATAPDYDGPSWDEMDAEQRDAMRVFARAAAGVLAGQGAAHPDLIEQVAGVIADAQPTAINGRSTDAARALANAGLLAKPVDWDMIERAARLLVTRVGRTEVTRSDIGLARDMFEAAGLLAARAEGRLL